MGSGGSSQQIPQKPVPPNDTKPKSNKSPEGDWRQLIDEQTERKSTPPTSRDKPDSPVQVPDADINAEMLQSGDRQLTTMNPLDRLPLTSGAMTSESTTLGMKPDKQSIHDKIAEQYSPRSTYTGKPKHEERPKQLQMVREETDIDEGEALQRLSDMLLKGSDKKQTDFYDVLEECRRETFRCQERALIFTGDIDTYMSLEKNLRDVILRLNQLNAGLDDEAEDQRMAGIRHAQTVLDQLRLQLKR